MAQPTWNTPAGSIGTFIEQVPVVFTFSATASSGLNTIEYTILNGEFPSSTSSVTEFSLNPITGVFTGTPAQVALSLTYSFTIRVFEYSGATVVSFRDRTFDMTVTGSTAPAFTTPAGPLFPGPTYLPDSTWTALQIGFTNPDPGISAVVTMDSGSLPPGLELNESGVIRGYAAIPTGTSQTYTFTLKVTNISGSDLRTFSITVVNQTSIPSLRNPTILNSRPLSFTIDPDDPYAAYYVPSTSNGLIASVGILSQNNYFIFKINGYAFTNNAVSYSVVSGSLPPGLTLNASTGWITGTISTSASVVVTYNPVIRVQDTVNLQFSSNFVFTMVVVDEIGNVPVDISVNWVTPSYLGQLNNGDISTFVVRAETPSGQSLTYSTVSTLPDNLQLLSTGEIVGRVAFETAGTVTSQGTTTTYNITVTAANGTYSEISSTKVFSFDVYQKFDVPYQNLYMISLLEPTQRTQLNGFLANTTLIPNAYLYRPTDPYFGKATDIKYLHFYGIETSSFQEFIDASLQNYYWRDITLGPINTAVAKNQNGEIIYEVVYCEVIDDLINPAGQSISSEILWPFLVNGSPTTVYPNSLPNMQARLINSAYAPNYINNLNADGSVLPAWMTSQQSDGSTLGFTRAWVICYTVPGKSQTVYKNLTQTYSGLPFIVIETQTIINELVLDPTVNTSQFYTNMPVTFTGTTFGGVATSITYYIKDVVSSSNFTISASIDGTALALTSALGTMTMVPSAVMNFGLNEFQFKLDRFTVDNSLTYNYDPTVTPPTSPWTALPSAGVTNDTQDFVVYYPQQNILN